MNTKVALQIVSGILNGLITAGALFTTLFGEGLTLKIIAGLGILGIVVNAVSAPFLTQSASMKEVAAITGDDGKPAVRINVNANAPQAVAAVALDPAQPNIGAANSDVRAALVTKAAS